MYVCVGGGEGGARQFSQMYCFSLNFCGLSSSVTMLSHQFLLVPLPNCSFNAYICIHVFVFDLSDEAIQY